MDFFGSILGKSETAAPFIQKAEGFFEKGKVEDAVKQCRRAVEIEPKNGNAWYLLGMGEKILGNYSDALNAFSQVSEITPEDPAVWIAMAGVQSHLGRFGDAVQALERLPESDVSRRDVLLRKAEWLEALGRYEESDLALSHILSDTPQDGAVIAWRINLLMRMGKYEESIPLLESALAIGYEPARMHALKGRALERIGDLAGALAAYRASHEIESEDPRTWYSRALIEEVHGDYAAAAASYSEVMRGVTEDSAAGVSRAHCLFLAGQYEEAYNVFEKVVAKDPEFIPTWYMLGITSERLGRVKRAAECFDHILKHDSSNVNSWYRRGLAMMNLGRYKEAIESFRRMQHPDGSKKVSWVTSDGEMSLFGRTMDQREIKDAPIEIESKNVAVVSLQALALARIGHYEDALRMINRLPADEKKNISIQLVSCEADAALGNYSGALHELESILKQGHAVPEAKRLYADVLMNTRKYREAALVYDEILADEPEDIKALRGRIEAHMRLGSFESCRDDLKTLIELSPKNWHAVALLADIYSITGDAEESLAIFDTLPEKHRKNPSYRMIRARALNESGRIDDALVELRAIREEDPQNAEALLLQAFLSSRKGNFSLAAGSLSDLKEKTDDAHGLSLWHAEILSMIGSDEEAATAYTEALSHNDSNPSALIGRADMFRRLGRLDSALADLRSALSIDPNYLHLNAVAGTIMMQRSRYAEAADAFSRSGGDLSLYQTAEALLRSGQFEDALSYFERYLVSRPDDLFPVYLAGLSAELLGRYREALQYYQQAEDVIADARFRHGALLNATGAYGDADRVLESFCLDHPDDIWGWYIRASVLEHLGQDQQAGDALQEAMNQGAESPGLLVSMAGILSRLGRFEDAAEICRTISEDYPDITMIHWWLGEISTLLGRSEDAANAYRKALAANPGNPVLVLAATEAFMKAGCPGEALQHLQRAGEVHPDDHRIWSAMGDALTAEGEYARAVVAYDRAISAGNVLAEVHHGRARALTLSGKWKEARNALSDYVSKEEHDLGTWFELGRLGESVGDLELAEKAYGKASGIPGAAFAHARALSLLGEDSQALFQIEELLERNPEDIEYLRFAATLFLKMGRYEEAVDAFSRALQKREDDHMLARGYASALESAGRYHDAVEAYTKLLKADPDSKTTMYAIGSLLTHLGQYRDAGRQFDQLVAEHPEDVAAIIRRGFVAERLGKFTEALDWYEKALSIDSKNGALWSTRGSILVNLSRYNDALKSFDRAIDLSQNEMNAWYCKGLILTYVGKKEQAMACFDHITENEPDHALAWYQKSRIYDSIGDRQEALRCLQQALEIDPDL